MKTSVNPFAFLSLVIALSACGAGGSDNNPPPPVSFGKWTWVSGSNTANQAGIYGTRGTAAPSNVPGARMPAAVTRKKTRPGRR